MITEALRLSRPMVVSNHTIAASVRAPILEQLNQALDMAQIANMQLENVALDLERLAHEHPDLSHYLFDLSATVDQARRLLT